jgi:type IV pilus assembly protein PilE
MTAVRRSRGFTLIEMVVAVAIIGILIRIALPTYRDQIRRGNRAAAQSQLVELAGLEEKIFLNSNAYTASITGTYTGASSGGLGVPTGKSRDGNYALSASASGASFTITATPLSTGRQVGDGNLTIASDGTRTWGSKTW